MKKKYFLEGKTINFLKVKNRTIKNKISVFECECICGNIKYFNGYDLNRNAIKSCGCSQDYTSTTYENIFKIKFWNQTKKCESGCVEWVGSKSEGYGTINYKGKKFRCTHLVWKWKNSVIPKGSIMCHKCDNPSCVNIDHLFVGTKKDNRIDCVNKNRHSQLKGEKNPIAKLKDSQIPEIRKMLNEGISAPKIAKIYGVGSSTIKRIKHKLTWAHIP